MKAGQPLLQLGAQYDPNAINRELFALHKRINDMGLFPNQAALKTTYAATDLGTAAHIATALNATNSALNAILSSLNLIQS